MSWSIIALMTLHLASLIFFLYTYFRTPPFPPTLVINLDERTDRWQEVQQEFKDWIVPIERMPAVKYSPGWKGCNMSHRKALELAKHRHYPWVLILEDDCVLTPGAKEQFHSLLPYLWKHQEHWDVFSGGTTYIEDAKLITKTPPLFRVKGNTTHFCLIHRTAYDKILRHMPSNPEMMTDASNQVIDQWYKKHLRIWVTVPFLAIQRPMHSDLEDKNVDYTQAFKDAETDLRKRL